MPLDLVAALTTSPFPERLAAAAALMVEGHYIEAVRLLEGTISQLEGSKVPSERLVSFRQLAAEGLRKAAARFASSHPYSSGADHYTRIIWLDQALELYRKISDVPNQVATLQALASANMAVGDAFKALVQLREVGTLAPPLFVLNVDEVRLLFSHLAEAGQAAYTKAVDHQLGAHYDLAIEAAAYRYLSGDPAQAMAELDELHGRYLDAAQSVHRSGGHDRAYRLLAQGIYWGLVTGHSDVLERYADLLVNYTAQNGNTEAMTTYDRVIVLRQAGAADIAQRLVMERATAILSKFAGTLNLNLFHKIMDAGSQYQMNAVDRALQEVNLTDEDDLKLLGTKRSAALLQLTSWAQTLNALVPVFLSEAERRSTMKDFISMGFTVSLQKANSAFGDANRQIGDYHRAHGRSPVSPMTVDLVRAVAVVQWSDPASVQVACAQFARLFKCTPAEVELALMPNGVGSSAEQRIRRALGDHDWEQIRRSAIARGLRDQFRIWEDRPEMRRRR